MDFVGIHHNITVRSLSENLLQLYHWKHSALYDIAQHISRSHAWQLVLIAYQYDPGSGCHSKKQGMHEKNIHHRHLINDDHIRI